MYVEHAGSTVAITGSNTSKVCYVMWPFCFDADHSMQKKSQQRDRYFSERKLFLPMLLVVLYISVTRCNGGGGSSLFLSISFLGKVHVV